jgi:hypothetical protein
MVPSAEQVERQPTETGDQRGDQGTCGDEAEQVGQLGIATDFS